MRTAQEVRWTSVLRGPEWNGDVSITLAMYDEKEILREYIESEKYEAAKEADRKTAIQLLKEGFSVEQIARCIPALSIDEVRKLQEELLQTV